MLGDVKIVSFGLPQVARHCTPRAVLGLNRLFSPISTRYGECTQEQAKKEMKSKNHDFIGKYRITGRADRGTGWGWLGNRMASSLRLNWSVIKA